MKRRKLTERQKVFVREYLLCRNGAEAARRAGFSANTAHEQAYKLTRIPHVKAAIQAGEEALKAKYQFNEEKILTELYRIAFFDVKKVMREEESGVSLKTWDELDEDVTRAIQSVTENESQFGTSRSIKAHCKLTALKLLGQHIGMFKDDRHSDEDRPTAIVLKYSVEKKDKA